MPAHKKHATKSSIAKLPSKKLCMSASPPSPPRLDLPPLLKKTWEFVRNAEEADGRTLAPLTGSALEAQLLIHRIEVRCCFGFDVPSSTPLTQSLLNPVLVYSGRVARAHAGATAVDHRGPSEPPPRRDGERVERVSAICAAREGTEDREMNPFKCGW